MNIPYVFKRCSKCGEWLVACSVNFHKQKRGKYGLQVYCKKCKTKYGKKYRNDNKDEILDRIAKSISYTRLISESFGENIE